MQAMIPMIVVLILVMIILLANVWLQSLRRGDKKAVSAAMGALWGGAPLQWMGEHWGTWEQGPDGLQGAKRCDNGCTK